MRSTGRKLRRRWQSLRRQRASGNGRRGRLLLEFSAANDCVTRYRRLFRDNAAGDTARTAAQRFGMIAVIIAARMHHQRTALDF